jgi:hypothetical protein
MSIRRVGEVSRCSFFNGSGKNVAASNQQRAFALGAEADPLDLSSSGNARRPHGQSIGRHIDGKLGGLAGGDVEDIQLAVHLVDDAVFVIGAGPAQIPVGAMGQLRSTFGLGVVGIEIERVVFV